MDVPPLLVPTLLLAAVLALSGALKLTETQATRDAFVSLGLPGRLATSPVPLLLPYAELGLAGLLVLAGGEVGLASSLAALALFGGYLAVIARALRSDTPLTCACFGRLGLGEVSRLTLARNGLLVACALLGVARAASGVSPVGQLAGLDGVEWVWLAMVVAAVTITGLVVLPGSSPPLVPTSTHDEYVRHPIPFGLLTSPDGTLKALRDLSRNGAVLLVFLSHGCAPCLRVVEQLPAFDDAHPEVSTVAVFHEEQRERIDEQAVGVPVLLDARNAVAMTFGSGTPSAVLLGADGLLAGGPVIGESDVLGFLADIAAELADHREAVA